MIILIIIKIIIISSPLCSAIQLNGVPVLSPDKRVKAVKWVASLAKEIAEKRWQKEEDRKAIPARASPG